MLSTLNAMEVGTLESIGVKLGEVEKELRSMNELELADRAAETLLALSRGDITEFKRGKAFLQSKIGHLRP
jgi:hypothetical protein